MEHRVEGQDARGAVGEDAQRRPSGGGWASPTRWPNARRWGGVRPSGLTIDQEIVDLQHS
jgi:hypothetical protein